MFIKILRLVQNLYTETEGQSHAVQEHTYIYEYAWPWRCHKLVHLIKLMKQAANMRYGLYRNIAFSLNPTYFIGAIKEGYKTTFFLSTYPFVSSNHLIM
jgi:hypothetical protein